MFVVSHVNLLHIHVSTYPKNAVSAYISILKHYHKEIEKSILHKVMMIKKIKIKKIAIFFYPDYHCHSTLKNRFNLHSITQT